MKLNKEWHMAHKMPKNATIEQRILWHTEYAKHCQCRTDIPKDLVIEMEKSKLMK